MSTILTAYRGRPLRRQGFDLGTFAGDALVFLIAALSAFDVTLVGQLPYSEVVLLVLLPAVLATQAHSIFRKEYRTIYILMGIWLLSQIATDFYRGMPIDNRLKGIARVVFFAIDLAVLSVLVGNNLRRIRVFFLGEAASGIFAWRLYLSSQPMDVGWKMQLSVPTANILLLIGSYYYYQKRKTGVAVAMLLVVAAIHLHFGVRSGVLIALAAVAIMLPIISPGPASKAPRLDRKAKLALLLLMGLSVIWLSEQAIRWGVREGIYDQSETNKFERQSAGKMGVIFGGRPEGPVAVQAIIDSPILGHGSYADDPKYIILLQDYQYAWGYTDNDMIDPTESDVIPSHSHLTMAWVQAGVFGSLLWFYLLGLIARSVLRLTEIRHPLTPLYLFTFITLFWDILFSPFGNTRRITEAFTILLMVNLMKKAPPGIAPGWRVRAGAPIPRLRPNWGRGPAMPPTPPRNGRAGRPPLSPRPPLPRPPLPRPPLPRRSP